MVIERQIDDTLYSFDTKSGELWMLGQDGTTITLPPRVLFGLRWFARMAGIDQHIGRIERKRLEQEWERSQ